MGSRSIRTSAYSRPSAMAMNEEKYSLRTGYMTHLCYIIYRCSYNSLICYLNSNKYIIVLETCLSCYEQY